ncbi:vacuolar iron transporter (VIT) family protein [Striga asiatica]|uniref:Vacuolar iron transporter (VIT) family protein n=1 Tax=Striga asiatica TaxID=4170 RepID=A0A5A7QYN6_STRAF|nr:vacuolar iron transporter (VIT) family protein [Striga asiatica]
MPKVVSSGTPPFISPSPRLPPEPRLTDACNRTSAVCCHVAGSGDRQGGHVVPTTIRHDGSNRRRSRGVGGAATDVGLLHHSKVGGGRRHMKQLPWRAGYCVDGGGRRAEVHFGRRLAADGGREVGCGRRAEVDFGRWLCV